MDIFFSHSKSKSGKYVKYAKYVKYIKYKNHILANILTIIFYIFTKLFRYIPYNNINILTLLSKSKLFSSKSTTFRLKRPLLTLGVYIISSKRQSIHWNNMLCLENIILWLKLSFALATLTNHIIQIFFPIKIIV